MKTKPTYISIQIFLFKFIKIIRRRSCKKFVQYKIWHLFLYKILISISTLWYIFRKTSSLVSCFSKCINFRDNEASDATLIKQMQIWIVLFEFQINGIIIYEIHPLSHKQISNYRRILELIIIMHVQYLFLFSSSSMLYGLGLAMIWLWNEYKHEI